MHPGNRVVNNNEKRNYLYVETVKKKDLKFQINNDHWIFQYLTNYSRHVGVSNNCQLLESSKRRGEKKKGKKGKRLNWLSRDIEAIVHASPRRELVVGLT